MITALRQPPGGDAEVEVDEHFADVEEENRLGHGLLGAQGAHVLGSYFISSTSFGDRIRPDLITSRGEMQKVGHDALGRACRRRWGTCRRCRGSGCVGRRRVWLMMALTCFSLSFCAIELAIRLSAPRGKTASSRILACGCLARMVSTMTVTPLAMPSAESVPELFVPIMRTNGLGLDAVEFSVLDAPEHMLGAVAADAEVRGLVSAESLVPDFLFARPSRR
jgi:hypothetical protein